MEDTEARVRKILVDHLGVDEAQTVPEATMEDLGCDSLDCVELEMALEEEFGFRVPNVEEGLIAIDTTVERMCQIVNERRPTEG